MKLVMLSGGSGKRLWPMSNDARSKQFLRVLQGPDGQMISMLQRVWGQLGHLGLDHDAYICASKAQRDMIESQIGLVPFIEEPMRRDTFPAIALAVTYLLDVVGVDDDEPVAVVPIDHMVDSSYFAQISRLGDVLAASGAELALMGVQPTEPTSKFGYIKLRPGGGAGREAARGHESGGSGGRAEGGAAAGRWVEVEGFVEKPDRAVANQLIDEGALWNCGVFCFKAGYIRDVLLVGGHPATYEALLRDFAELPKRSFDYEVVEKATWIVASPYSGEWNDLGTWEALSGEIASPFVGIGTAVQCEDTHVINELGMPLVAMGLRDAMVVATPDGILVADKAHTGQLKQTVEVFGSRPMFEERRWGNYRVLDYQKLADGTEVLTKCIQIDAGKNLSYQKHEKRSEVWTFLQGEGEVVLDTRSVAVRPGDVVRVYPEQWHAIRAVTDLMFVEVQRGSELVEEDVFRRYLAWDEIERHCRALV